MVESKQIKVDNWGIFFLQRLQQFYNNSSHCDLTLLFDDHRRIRVHRLVLNACTEYFQVLEKTCPIEDNCMRMPANLPSEIVIPIINFMYSGILDLNEASFDRLYTTAKLMNMSVLTKLLDAQKTPIKPIMPQKRLHATPISWHSPGKKVVKSTFVDDLPETLPGRKLPIWRRKSLPVAQTPYLGHISSQYDTYTPLKPIKKFVSDEPPKPTRFDWPENDSENNFDNAFDDISYESKPLILPTYQAKEEKSPKPSTSSTFEEIKKTAAPVKRSASPIGNQPKKVNLQDVKEYLKEHKIRSDYIDYEEEEGPDNDLQPFDNEGDSAEDISQNVDDTPNKSILKNEGGNTPSNKHVRFSLEGEDDKKSPKKHVSFSLEAEEDKKAVKVTPKGAVAPKSEQDMSKHTKIIAEVLKKYPHLVKHNKNIRLKILAKGNGSPSPKAITKSTPTKNQASTKVSYMVMRPDESKKQKDGEKEHICTKCDKPLTFQTYPQLRQHLTDVHNERQDSQMCMVCGHVARKQNMLAYHKFVKHNITPPVMYNFPKCKECPYIALSSVVLQKHMATHTSDNQFVCKICNKKFVSEANLNMHMESIHGDENKEVKIATKEKIKIISDVKVVNQNLDYQSNKEVTTVPTEPSSEAEALSNVASGIAASLGLVDTIVVLDDNQFILQSQGANIQQNIINTDGQEYIIPEMQLNEMEATPGAQNQQNNVLTQTIKTGITSTDELVMVLTDHDYGDGNNAVITDNNIVVLYSHPVQTQAGTMMLTSEGNMIEVDKSYAQNIPVTIAGSCEESIEMIQQEINNQLDTPQEINNPQIEQEAPLIQSNIEANQVSLPEKIEDAIEEQSYTELQQEQPQDGALEQVEQVSESVQEVEQVTMSVEDIAVQGDDNASLMQQENEHEMDERLTQLDDQTGQVVYITQSEENAPQIIQESMEVDSQMQETRPNEIEPNENDQNVSTIEESLPQSDDMVQFEEDVPQIEQNNPEEGMEQMETDVTQAEQVTQDQNEIVQDPNELVQAPNQSTDLIEDENHFQESQLQENLTDIPVETMEMDQNVCEETSECVIEENIDQAEENMLQEEQSIPQLEETSQVQEISENVPLVETDATTQQEEEISTLENLPNDSEQVEQEVMEQNEVQIESNMLQVEEEASQMDQPTPEGEQEAQILNQIEENMVENEEEIVQDENVPYEEERMPIDASLEQIGDIPQNEENGTSLSVAQDSVEAEVDETVIENETEVTESVENEQEVTQIDLNETEVTQIDQNDVEVDQQLVQEDAILELNENVTEVSQDLDQNDVVTDEHVQTGLVEEVVDNIDTKTQDINKETPIQVKHDRIMKILDDWDDGESDSQQSLSSKSQQNINEEKIESSESIKKLIDDWEEEEDT